MRPAVRVAAPILAVLVAAWSPTQTRAPFSAAVPVAEAIASPGLRQLVCGLVTGARSGGAEFGTILRLSDPERAADLLVTVSPDDRSRFGRLLETQLVRRVVCLRGIVVAMPGGPVIELTDPDFVQFVSAPPAPDEEFVRLITRTASTVLPVPIEPRNPIYAPRARAALVQGDAEVLVRIDATGRVEAARILGPLDPLRGLDDEALATAFLWKFRPAIEGVDRVPSIATVVMGFDLGVSRSARTDLVVQLAGHKAAAVVASPLAASDPFVGGAAVSADVPPAPWWVSVPPYSFGALKAGIEGVVGLDVAVGVDGLVTNARVARSLAGGAHGLDSAALAAVRGWRFTPALVGGVPVAAVIRVEVRYAFVMRDDPR